MAAKRFASLAADEIEKKKLLINSKETIRSNQKAARLLKAYLGELNQNQNFEEFDAVRLNEVLCHFYMNARKQDGEFYKATTFENMRHAINRYLRDPPYNRKFDIIKDDEFRDANVSFKAALAELKRIGKGSVQHHPVINESDRQKLYESNQMNPQTPYGLLNKVQFDVRLYFCRRSVENMHIMSKSTFEVMQEPKSGLKYVAKCTDELTKNHRGNDRETTSGVMPESPGSPFCPVRSLEKYIGKLHPSCSSLWQRPRDSFDDDDETWYCNVRLVQSLTVYQRTDTEEKIAMGQAMGQSLALQSFKTVSALPSTATLALPPPESVGDTSLVTLPQEHGDHEAVAELQGINISDLFGDFNCDHTLQSQTETRFSSVQTRQIMPAFHRCTIGTINFSINISK
ncbi:uncharacterized protein LOC130050522 [Ostrea edulis]|uniref:uncharacterized protein LOC130050522 n=1 Tax=Ostrea edulis TaxID=37623 RepID=UPI0024AF9F8C|nr:uncharacterized protein LOC130050522 [Ostrea edulis]